ncbi:Uridine kinase-like protein 5 [Vitis vinifera]|uniref:Uridine kinase n=1 Tax=Vitis vinifera TaxID=29760 RepID=A0A438D1T1_VITVI|nr:Uridine kinase-like protein 5 [Vitis vinifera]
MDSDTLAEQIKEHFKYDASEAPAPPLKQPFVIGKNIVSPTENDTQNNGFICFSAPCLLTYDMLCCWWHCIWKNNCLHMIIAQLHDQRVVLVNQDSFYCPLSDGKLEKVLEINFDHPDAFNTELLLACMDKLKNGQAVSIPNYDFKTHKNIEPGRKINASDVIILEGILVLHDPRVRDLMNMKIFVDTDCDVRLARRIQRDTVERGRDIDNVLDQYDKFVKPSFEEYILPSKKYADIIIPRGGDNDIAVDLIVQHIRTKLGQHDICKIYPNVFIIRLTFQIRGMHTLIRDVKTTKHDFVFYADRLIRLVVEHGLGHLPFTEKQITTPTGSVYSGVVFCRRLCGVSIIRSGESMENALRACCKGIKIGKILIHGEGNDGRQLIYENLPDDIASRHVLLLDPVLASGNSAVKAISLLLSKGVAESNIIFLNLIAAPEGIHAVCKKFPTLKIVTSEIDMSLNKDLRVIPGMGSLEIDTLAQIKQPFPFEQ